MLIREERPEDAGAIHALVTAAFNSNAEAALVDALRADGDLVHSLVAAEGPDFLGHIAFSRMTAPFAALGLAPLAVTPARQGQGIGARLIEAGLALARRGDWRGVFVLGDPAYYGKFGFAPALAAGFNCVYAGPHLMALPLGGDFPTHTGDVAYAPAFAALG
ncbi:MAG: N-acetyltransferase [Rhodospirillaceae bacterium]|nr:N-acetyltransferase [Rhodospirillaceae bacterium]